MQGGIRRGNDLLPRYNVQGRSKGWLTTRTKKLIVYIVLLSFVWVLIRFSFSGKDAEVVEFELERAVGSAGVSHDALESQMNVADAILQKSGGGGDVKKEKFSDEMVSPQDRSNGPAAAAKKAQNSVGNGVKADKQGTPDIDKKAQEIKEAAPYKKNE